MYVQQSADLKMPITPWRVVGLVNERGNLSYCLSLSSSTYRWVSWILTRKAQLSVASFHPALPLVWTWNHIHMKKVTPEKCGFQSGSGLS